MSLFDRGRVHKTLPALLFTLLFLAFAPCAQAKPKFQMAPLNPAFVEYTLQLGQSEARGAGEHPAGLVPSPIDWSRIGEAKVGDSFWQKARAADALPTSFDLVAEGRVTPVLDQGKWGTCWAFATTEAVESSLLSEGKGTYNLSEMHLAYYAYVDESEDMPAFTANSKFGENPVFDNGGSAIQATALYSRGTGPISETDAPYPSNWPDDSSTSWVTYRPNPAPSGKTAFRLQSALRFTTTEDVKRAVMEIGGLTFSVHANEPLKDADGNIIGVENYVDNKTGTMYVYNDGLNTNHAVMLVGWDDSFPRESFVRSDDEGTTVMPTADGAWKIQNSWGEDRGDHGYYWVSYEDKAIHVKRGTWGFKMDPADSYDGIYSHDPLGACNFVIDDSAFQLEELRVDMANVFTARRDEKIVFVNFVTLNSDIDYEIQIYKNITGDFPDTGTPIWSAPQKSTAAASGYITTKLDNPVALANGERFAVCVTLFRNGKGLYIPVEVAIDDYSDKAIASPGESYLRVDEDGWEDTADGEDKPFNLCVKAYTVAADASDTNGSGGSSGCASGVAGAALFALLFVAIKRRRI